MAVGSGLGIDSFVRFKKETAWGTRATTGFWTIPIVSENIQLVLAELESQSITSIPAPDANIPGPRHVEGGINFQASYNLMDQFLYGIMGKVVDSTPATATLTRDHWFELTTDQPSWTVEVNRGDVEHDNDVHPYLGMLVSSLELTIPESGYVTGAATFLGKDDQYALTGVGSGLTASAQIASDPFAPFYIPSHGPNSGSVTVAPAPDAGLYCVRQITVKIDRKLSQNGCIGSLTLNQPQPDQLVEVSGQFTVELKDENIYDSYVAFTEQTGNTFQLSSSIIEAALRYEFQVKLNRMRWLAPSAPFIDRRGRLLIQANYKCFGGAGTGAIGTAGETSTKEPISIRTRNQKASTLW